MITAPIVELRLKDARRGARGIAGRMEKSRPLTRAPSPRRAHRQSANGFPAYVRATDRRIPPPRPWRPRRTLRASHSRGAFGPVALAGIGLNRTCPVDVGTEPNSLTLN